MSRRLPTTMIDAMSDTNSSTITKHRLIFDGECRFCRSQIAILKRLDIGKQLDFISLHDPQVALLVPDLTYEQLMEQMWLVTRDEQRFGGADAVRYLSRHLPLLFPLMPFLHIPFSAPLWHGLYKLIARFRYRIAGRSCEGGTCEIHFGKPAASGTKGPKAGN